MARLNLFTILLYLWLSIVSSNESEIQYPSSIAAGVEEESDSDFLVSGGRWTDPIESELAAEKVTVGAISKTGGGLKEPVKNGSATEKVTLGAMPRTGGGLNGPVKNVSATQKVSMGAISKTGGGLKEPVKNGSAAENGSVSDLTRTGEGLKVPAKNRSIAGRDSVVDPSRTNGGLKDLVENGSTANKGSVGDLSKTGEWLKESLANEVSNEADDGSGEDISTFGDVWTETSTSRPTSPSQGTTPQTTTTVQPISTTTPVPPDYQLPDFGDAPPFVLLFVIGFNRNWTEDFADGLCEFNKECQKFKKDVEKEIEKAFKDCPGYLNNTVVVTSFSSSYINSSVAANEGLLSLTKSERSPAVKTESDVNYTYADYTTSFDNAQILSDSESVVNYIGNDTVAYLQTADFNGSQALNESLTGMNDVAQYQIEPFTNEACPVIGHYLCSVCFPCSEDNALGFTVSCHSNCSENEVCTLAADNIPGCMCKDNYLPMGGDCVDQNIIIGVSAGIGGAIVLGLIIALIILGCREDKKDKDLSKTQASHDKSELDDAAKGIENAGIELDEHSSHGEEQREIFIAMPGTSETDSVQVAAPVAEMKADYDGSLDPASPLPAAAAAGAAVEAIEPVSSSHPPLDPTVTDQYRSLYFPQSKDGATPKNTDYEGFVPRLDTVDTETEYAIPRSRLVLQPARNYKDFVTEFF